MTLYKLKPLDIAFIVLSHDGDSGKVRSTVRSIKRNYNFPVTVVMSDEAHSEEVARAEALCEVVRGGKTITSLMNAGMDNCKNQWGLMAMSGSHIPRNFDNKFSIFVESDYDILFPVMDRRCNFVDATLNGLMISKVSWDKIGPMASKNNLEICKLFWALGAIEAGCRFKAVVGAKIC